MTLAAAACHLNCALKRGERAPGSQFRSSQAERRIRLVAALQKISDIIRAIESEIR